MNKVVIIGTGFVGSTIAYAISLRNQVNNVVLINRDIEPSIGEMLDINHGFESINQSLITVGDYSMISDAELIIISAGRNRKPGETRSQLAVENALIMREITEQIKQHYSKGKILVITNPVDVLTQLVDDLIGSPDIEVIGSGTLLDTSRLRYALSNEQASNQNELLIGEHGDGIVPLTSSFDSNGRFITDLDHQARVMDVIRGLGAQIISSKGKTHFGIATCVSFFIDALQAKESVLTAMSIPLRGQLGISCALSVPVAISQGGIELRLDLIQPLEVSALQQIAIRLQKVLEEIRS